LSIYLVAEKIVDQPSANDARRNRDFGERSTKQSQSCPCCHSASSGDRRARGGSDEGGQGIIAILPVLRIGVGRANGLKQFAAMFQKREKATAPAQPSCSLIGCQLICRSCESVLLPESQRLLFGA